MDVCDICRQPTPDDELAYIPVINENTLKTETVIACKPCAADRLEKEQDNEMG